MVGVVPLETHDYTATDCGVSSSEPFIGWHSADMCFEGDRGLGEEHDRVRYLHIDREAHERVDDDDGDGDDDDHDDGEDTGYEEQPVPVAPVAPTSGSDWRPRHEKGKGLTGSFMSVISKISGEVLLTQSSSHHTVGMWQDRGLLKCRSCYMTLTEWNLTDAQVVSLATEIGLMHLRSCIFQHPNSALLSTFVEQW
ncbi:hypothetical protein M9H77_18426 [Catharanthus roseus]|uniref:Uncharacterized protein n=1 Tax=Catharanthus roseus TaxID=4058 RepID=A0ACC0B7R1_CATRO|nr:hypothetical protein M9H77_18426 [Catharanthus roseus]